MHTDSGIPFRASPGVSVADRLRLLAIIGVAVAGVLVHTTRGYAAAGGAPASSLPALLFALPIGLWAVATVLRARTRRAEQRRILVVGDPIRAAAVAAEIAAAGGYRIVGVVTDAADDLDRMVAAGRPALIVIAATRRSRVQDDALLRARMHGIAVESAQMFLERLRGKLPIEVLRPSALILSSGFRHLETVQGDLSQRMTRAVSVVVAVAGLVLLLPLLAWIALAIKLDSPGPVFFVQPRVGRGGRHFDLIKFRTMSCEAAPSEWVRDSQHRITRLGRFLRRFRLDELPQFLNVLRGDMTLVGPRPHPVSNYQLFLEHIPYYAVRECVPPGITGWAQIRYGYANSLEEETEKMRYDLYYIKYRSFWMDLRILAGTIRVLLFDRRSHESARPGPTIGPTWQRAAHGAASR